jgi:uncharacterized protein (UPF0248 family)
MARNILNMILWHPEIEIQECQITYQHRGSLGNLKTIPAANIERLEGGFMIMFDGSQVPYHRIVKVECDEKIIWKKSRIKGDSDD